MRNRIARAGTALAAGVAVASLVGMSAATAASASVKPAATPACGAACTDTSSRILGLNTLLNAYVPGDTGSGEKAGQLINMNQGGNNHPNEDFLLRSDGPVSSQCRGFFNPDGILPSNSVLCVHDSTAQVYELNFAPFGNESGLCVGTTGTPLTSLAVRLTACGTTEGSILVRGDGTMVNGVQYYTYISGATTSFSHPYVLTVNTGSSGPQNQIQVTTENLLSGFTASDDQLFNMVPGPF